MHSLRRYALIAIIYMAGGLAGAATVQSVPLTLLAVFGGSWLAVVLFTVLDKLMSNLK